MSGSKYFHWRYAYCNVHVYFVIHCCDNVRSFLVEVVSVQVFYCLFNSFMLFKIQLSEEIVEIPLLDLTLPQFVLVPSQDFQWQVSQPFLFLIILGLLGDFVLLIIMVTNHSILGRKWCRMRVDHEQPAVNIMCPSDLSEHPCVPPHNLSTSFN